MNPPGFRWHIPFPPSAILLLVLTAFLPDPGVAQNLPMINPNRTADDSLFTSGIAAYGEGRFQDALECYRKIQDTTRRGLHFNLATAYMALGDLKVAEKELRRAVVSDTASNRPRLQLAELLEQQGRITEAEAIYRAVLLVDPKLPAALEGLGVILVRKHAYAEALPILTRAISSSPRNAVLYAQIGTALLNLGAADSAQTMFATCLALSPSNVPVMVQLGSIYFGRREFADALRLFGAAAKAEPWNSDVLYKAGLCEEKLDNLADATDFFSAATETDSTNALAFGHLGSVYYQRRLYDSSVAAYKNAAALTPENSGVYINLGISYSFMDSIAQAIRSLRQAITVMDAPAIGQVYERIGALQFRRNQYAEAKESYRKALQFEPASASSLFYEGFCCDQLGQYDQAKRFYRSFLKAVKGSDDTVRIQFVETRLKLLGTGDAGKPGMP